MKAIRNQKNVRKCVDVRHLSLGLQFTLFENEIRADDAFPHILYVFHDSLEVRCGIV